MEKIRIVTDSVADLPVEIAKELGIVVVPANVTFGLQSYKDGTEMTKEEFYQRLKQSNIHPTTSATAPGEFANVYRELAAEADTIISVHASKKLSALYNSAMIAKSIVEKETDCKIVVVDSCSAAMGIGLPVIMAAKLARTKKTSEEIVRAINGNISHVHLLAIVDTLKYIEKGGRAKMVIQKIGSFLPKSLKLSLTIEEGEARFTGFVRIHKRQERFMDFIKNFPKVEEIALEYSPDSEGIAEGIIKETERGVKSLFPAVPLYFSVLTPALGAQVGPGVIAVILREGAM